MLNYGKKKLEKTRNYFNLKDDKMLDFYLLVCFLQTAFSIYCSLSQNTILHSLQVLLPCMPRYL